MYLMSVMHLLNIMIIKNEEAREDVSDDFKWNHKFLNLGMCLQLGGKVFPWKKPSYSFIE